jgi:hypothetical protein
MLPGTGVEPGSVASRGGSAARGDQEHVGCPLPLAHEATSRRRFRNDMQDAADMFPETGQMINVGEFSPRCGLRAWSAAS